MKANSHTVNRALAEANLPRIEPDSLRLLAQAVADRNAGGARWRVELAPCGIHITATLHSALTTHRLNRLIGYEDAAKDLSPAFVTDALDKMEHALYGRH